MRIIDLVIKDLLQIFRDKRSVLFLVAMPIAFTFFMGFAYQSGEDAESQSPRVSFAWVETATVNKLSQKLYVHLEKSNDLRPMRMDKGKAIESLKEGKVEGVLIIPPGLDEYAEGTVVSSLAKQRLTQQIILITDPASIGEQYLYQQLRVSISQLMSAVEISRMSVDTLDDPAEFTPAFDLAWEKWEQNRTESLVHVEEANAQESESWFGDNTYNQASPGILVQFAIMGLVTSAQILVQERKRHTLQRLMSTAMKPSEIMIGHMLGVFVIVFFQTALLIIFGQLILSVDYLREPMGVLLVSVGLGLWVSSMGLLIGLLANGDNQVVLYSMIAMFVFSALGGAWFPLETSGGIFASIGKTLPSAWAMTGFHNILIGELGLSSVWQPVGILTAYALGFFVLAAWRIRTMAA